MMWGMAVKLHAFIISAIDGCRWSDLYCVHFTLEANVTSTHETEGRIGLRASLDKAVKKQILTAENRGSDPDDPAHSQSLTQDKHNQNSLW
jgi:hypothetical protein